MLGHLAAKYLYTALLPQGLSFFEARHLENRLRGLTEEPTRRWT